MRRALFWLLLPMAIPQALRVRRTAPRFAAASGPLVGRVGEGSSLRLLAIGDSIVAGVGARITEAALAGATASALSRLLPRSVSWQAQGKIGAGIAEMREHLLPALDDTQFDVVLVSIGVNDVTGLMRSGRWARALGAFLKEVRDKYPHAVVALAGIPPLQGFPLLPFPLRWIFGLRGRTFDHLARTAVDVRAGMLFLPLEFDPTPEKFAADGFHPSQESYAVIGSAFAERLAPALASR